MKSVVTIGFVPPPSDLRGRIHAAIERLRMRIAFRLIGGRSVLANVDVGGNGPAAITGYGGRIWANAGVRITSSPHLQFGIIMHPREVVRPDAATV